MWLLKTPKTYLSQQQAFLIPPPFFFRANRLSFHKFSIWGHHQIATTSFLDNSIVKSFFTGVFPKLNNITIFLAAAPQGGQADHFAVGLIAVAFVISGQSQF